MGNDLTKKYNEAWDKVEIIKNNEGKYEGYIEEDPRKRDVYNIPHYQNALGQPYFKLTKIADLKEILCYTYYSNFNYKILSAMTDKYQRQIIKYLINKVNYCVSQNNVDDIADYLLIINRHIKPIIKILNEFTIQSVAEDLYENPYYAYGRQGDWQRAENLNTRTKELLKKYIKAKFTSADCIQFATDIHDWLDNLKIIGGEAIQPGLSFYEIIADLYNSLNGKLERLRNNPVSNPTDEFTKIANLLSDFDKNYNPNINNKKVGGLFSLDSENSISVVISAIIIFVVIIAIITLIYILLKELGIITEYDQPKKPYTII